MGLVESIFGPDPEEELMFQKMRVRKLLQELGRRRIVLEHEERNAVEELAKVREETVPLRSRVLGLAVRINAVRTQLRVVTAQEVQMKDVEDYLVGLQTNVKTAEVMNAAGYVVRSSNRLMNMDSAKMLLRETEEQKIVQEELKKVFEATTGSYSLDSEEKIPEGAQEIIEEFNLADAMALPDVPYSAPGRVGVSDLLSVGSGERTFR